MLFPYSTGHDIHVLYGYNVGAPTYVTIFDLVTHSITMSSSVEPGLSYQGSKNRSSQIIGELLQLPRLVWGKVKYNFEQSLRARKGDPQKLISPEALQSPQRLYQGNPKHGKAVNVMYPCRKRN